MKQNLLKTKITTLLNISSPIIQAPMAGGATTPELVAAVSNAGGLGSLGAGYMTADEIKLAIKKIRKLTDKPFAVNLFIPESNHTINSEQILKARKAVQQSCSELHFNISMINPPYSPSFDEQMNLLLDEKVPIFTFTFGLPSSFWLESFKLSGIKLIGTATTLEEALYLEKHGLDAIVAQGIEAGGHRGTFLSSPENPRMNLANLTSLIVKNSKLPVIAAGGIMNGIGVVETLANGAAGVQMGTAFLCCEESGIHPLYKQKLLSLTSDTSILTRAFSGKFARGIPNKFITRMKKFESTILEYPFQNALTRDMRKEAAKQNNIDFMSLWAGCSAYLCKEQSTGELMKELIADVEKLLMDN